MAMLYVDPVLRTRAGFDFASILKPENRTNAKPEPFVLPRLFSSSRTLICSYPQSCLCVNMVVGRTGVLAILILVMLVELPQGAKATPPWGLDGIGSGTNVGIRCNGTCDARYLTTSRANDLIILVVSCMSNYDSCVPTQLSSITDSSGLKFTQRSDYTDPGVAGHFSPSYRIWEYYTVAKSRLSSDNVTVTWSNLNGMDQMQVFAVHGYGSEHFDVPSPVLVSSGSCVDATCLATLGTSGKDFVFAYLAENDIAACSLTQGWTNMFSYGYSEADYTSLNAPNPNVQFTCNNLEDPSPILMDAILLQPS